MISTIRFSLLVDLKILPDAAINQVQGPINVFCATKVLFTKLNYQLELRKIDIC